MNSISLLKPVQSLPSKNIILNSRENDKVYDIYSALKINPSLKKDKAEYFICT